MARIRTIKPEFQNSQSMGRISRDARLCFVLLWPQCDDAGRIRANSRMLASVLFPYDEDAPVLIGGWLSELENEGCIVRYAVERDEYLQVCHWDHQKIDHPQPSKLPAPQHKKSNKTRLSVREHSRETNEPSLNLRAVSSTVSRINTVSISSAGADGCLNGFDGFYAAFPRRVARRAAEKAYKAALSRGTSEAILLGAKKYAASVHGKELQYVSHPASWLNADRWLDDMQAIEIPPPPPTPDEIEANKDRADKLFKRGKYAEQVA